MSVENVIIIGSGCAGFTAAIYTARANLTPLLFEGLQTGGQLATTTLVENYPGFAEGIQGPELMEIMKKQAARFGTRILSENVTRCDFSKRPFRVWSSEETYEAKSIIISTGASSRMLGLSAEKRLLGYGLSTCATCDGFFFKEKELVVVGGGDSAMEESIFLTKFAKKVTVVHRRDKLRASKIMQDRAFKNPKIDFIWDSAVEDIYDPKAQRVTGVLLRNLKTEKKGVKECQGLFIAIGHEPNTKLFQGQIELDAKGYLLVKEGSRTSVPGVFAAGDCVDHVYKQAVTAAGMGCMSAMDAEKFLEANP